MGAPIELSCVSWNIHKGIGGVDRRYRLERVIDVLAEIDADLVFLQEVDEGAKRSRFERQIDRIGDALGLAHRAYHPNHRLRLGHYGNAVLSRLALDHAENVDLTEPLHKHRGALHVRTNAAADGTDRRVWIYNVHLGLAEAERQRQLNKLLNWHGRRHAAADTVVVLAGDFNDVYGRLHSDVLERAGFAAPPARPRTFPAALPVRPLDAIFVRGPAELTHLSAVKEGLASRASDHLPIVAKLRVT